MFFGVAISILNTHINRENNLLKVVCPAGIVRKMLQETSKYKIESFEIRISKHLKKNNLLKF